MMKKEWMKKKVYERKVKTREERENMKIIFFVC